MPTPEQRYLGQWPDVSGHDYWSQHPRKHWEQYGRDAGRDWPYISYVDRTREVLELELGREPTQDELAYWSNEVRNKPALLNEWFVERQRLGLEVPYGWGTDDGFHPQSMIPQADPWDRIEAFLGDDFKIDLDPEGKWATFEDAILEDARTGVDPDQWASRAATDVKAAHKGQEAAIRRDAGRMGINPNSGAFGAALSDSGLGVARDQVTAMTQARMGAEDMNRELRHSALQHGLQSQQLGLQAQLAEEGARLERAGLGLDMHKYNLFDRHHQDKMGLGWGELGYRFYDTDMRAKHGQDALKAKGRSDLWGGAATLGVGILKNWDNLKDMGSTVYDWIF